MASVEEVDPSLHPCGGSCSLGFADGRKAAPHPIAPVRDVGKEGADYVKKMVEYLMNSKNHKRIFAKEDDDPLYSVAKKLLGQLYTDLASPVDRVGDWEAVHFDAGLVTKLVTEALFHGWDMAEGRSGAPSQSGEGTRVGVGGDVFSKSIKLEMLAHLESMATSDRVELDRELENVMGSAIAGCGIDPNDLRYIAVVDKNMHVRRLPVCGNASENAAVDNVEYGTKTSDNLSVVVTCNEEKNLEVAAGGVPCSLGTNDAVLEMFQARAVGEAAGLADEPVMPTSDPVLALFRGFHIDCAGSSNSPAKLDCGGLVGSLPACINALENSAVVVGFEQPQAHDACGLVVVKDVERSLERDFLSPILGVQLAEWIKVTDLSIR